MAVDFFESFPVTYYNFNTEQPILLTHILRRFAFKQRIKEIVSEYDPYIVSDGETPEMVSYNVYGNMQYHWVILMFNNITDPFTEWVMSSETLERYINEKYQNNRSATHHWERNGRIVPEGTEGAENVTNEEFEFRVNEHHRKILIPKKIYLSSILKEFENVLKEIN